MRSWVRGHGRPGTVTVHSVGGLGNQLFIYAAGLAAARSCGARLRVDVSLHHSQPDRPFLLQQLGFEAEYVDLSPRQSSAVQRRVPQVLREPRSPRPGGSTCDFQQTGFLYDGSLFQQQGGSCLSGYFQSWKYVEPVAPMMRATLQRVADE